MTCCAQFGRGAQQVFGFDGIPVAAAQIGKTSDVDGLDGAQDLADERIGIGAGGRLTCEMQESRRCGAEDEVVVQQKRRCEF